MVVRHALAATAASSLLTPHLSCSPTATSSTPATSPTCSSMRCSRACWCCSRARTSRSCYLDTHAGIGLYDLKHPWAQKLAEHREGIDRVWERNDVPDLLAPYLDAVRADNPDGRLRFYPGSPRIARRLLQARPIAWSSPSSTGTTASSSAHCSRTTGGCRALHGRLPGAEGLPAASASGAG